MKAKLEKYDHYVSKGKIARLMPELNLIVKRKHKFKITTDRNHKHPVAPNLLDEDFKVHRKIKYGYLILPIYTLAKVSCI